MKTITEISTQKKNPKRCNLYLDGEFFCGVELITVMQARLKVGTKISEQKLNEIVLSSEREKAMQLALNYVSRSLHTKVQIEKYLKGKGFLPEIVTEVLNKLKEYGYVNDDGYAKAYINEKKGSKGKRLIKYELKLKGVDEKIIDKELDGDFSEEEGAMRVALKFFKGKEKTYENTVKCYRRLLSKGFDYDVAKSVVEKIKDEDL